MYRTIETSLWTDPCVQELNLNAKLIFLYLITCTHTHVSGIYYLPIVLIEKETGMTRINIKRSLEDLVKTGFISFDGRRSIVWIKNMFHYQGRGKLNNKAAASHLNSLHRTPLITDFLDYYPQVKKLTSDIQVDTPEQAAKPNDKIIKSNGHAKSKLSDDEWLAALRINPAYQHIDLGIELAKMDAWLDTPQAKSRKKTRRFIVNWLNRIEREIPKQVQRLIKKDQCELCPTAARFWDLNGRSPRCPEHRGIEKETA